MNRTGLLFLAHRIPYPPDKGDKIRSYNLLRYLCQHYDVYLGAFVDDERDWQHRGELQKICKHVKLLPLSPLRSKLKSLIGLLTGEALSLPYYRSNEMRTWANGILEKYQPETMVVYSSTMAQYLEDSKALGGRRIIDMVDIDSDKWRQYASTVRQPLKFIYAREAEKLQRYEKKVVENFDYSFFVSSSEADAFRNLFPEGSAKVGYYNNGVDYDYFDPRRELPTPYGTQEKVLVFTGAMDYWPNENAAVWFAKEVMPILNDSYPQLKFYIVGRDPGRRVKELTENPNVVVTGPVADVRPYLKYAVAAVAPMRIARGIQNKVLEAMAMAKPVMVSPLGLEGIQVGAGEVMVANAPADYLLHLQALESNQLEGIGNLARKRVQVDFGWESTLRLFGQKLNVVAY